MAFVYPGLGHLYLREWLRSLLWFGLVVTTSMLLVPASVYPSEVSVDAMMAAYEALPTEATLSMLVVTLFSMADAYWIATRQTNRQQPTPEGDQEGAACPNCGKELDEDLTFCHWCTTRLDEPAGDGEETTPSR
ncbi:MAG: zinc ribbon domain-containing protein [Haloarculaceae archaeon]